MPYGRERSVSTKKKQPQRRRSISGAHPQALPIRVTPSQLKRINALVRAESDPSVTPNRSMVIARIAYRQARCVLNAQMPLLLTTALDFSGATTTISISFSRKQELEIRRACDALNQRFSPFVLWAVMAYAEWMERS